MPTPITTESQYKNNNTATTNHTRRSRRRRSLAAAGPVAGPGVVTKSGLSGLVPFRGAAVRSSAVAAACADCDAECDMFVFAVPQRECKAGEKASRGVLCGVPSKGAGRVVWKYKNVDPAGR